MFVYRNNNTGDVVRYKYRSPRLDMLPNWELIEEPTAADGPDDQIPQEPAPAPPSPEEPGVQETALQEPNEPPGGGEGDGSGPGVVERPARSASKADWAAYARARAQDSDEEATIGGLTKEQLIEQYGGNN
ncbi:hypothetical protein AB0I98_16760 [Streptomyces sp. NPDC050211]|uniref:hypothetical protein n=1 Tax=Streptomyces sp. NPDC050211 TaxID=3154932 RepID=UPI00343D83A3